MTLYVPRGRHQRALIHQWQTASYLLTAEALILGLSVSMGATSDALPMIAWICLFLTAPIALAAAAMRLRWYKAASMCGTLGGVLYGLVVLAILVSLLPWLLQPWLGNPITLPAPILQMVAGSAIAVPLTGAAVSGVAWGRALRIPVQPRRLRAKA